jgi:myo-inositol catabolism protein IolS
MKYRRLGKTKLEISVVGIGTWQYGGEWGRAFTQAEVDAIIDTGRSAGINMVDTAECYGDHLSEQLVGRAIHRDRENWVVATKFGHKFTGLFERDQRWGAREVQESLETSLKALDVDYVDLYQFHSGDNGMFNNDELWTMLDKQVKAGKVKHLGISVSQACQDDQTKAAGRVGAEVIQVIYNRLERSPEAVVIPSCKEQDLGILARVPLASGFLSGKYKKGTRFESTDTRSRREPEQIDRMLDEVERIRREEVPAGVDMASWALAWCLKNPAITCVIPGCKDPAQVRSNAAATEVEIVA